MIKGTEFIHTNGDHATVLQFDYKGHHLVLQQRFPATQSYWWHCIVESDSGNFSADTGSYENPIDALIKAKQMIDEAKS